MSFDASYAPPPAGSGLPGSGLRRPARAGAASRPGVLPGRRPRARILRLMLLSGTIVAGLAGVLSATAHAAPDDQIRARLEALEKRLAEQDRLIDQQQAQIRDLKTRSAAGFSEAKRLVEEQPKLSVANARPTFTSADGNFAVSLRGRFHYDLAQYAQDLDRTATPRAATGGDAAEAARALDLNSGGNFRRAQIGIEGTVLKDWAFNITYEVGGSGQEDGGRITETWLGYNGIAPFRFQIGAFPPPANLDDATSSNDTAFIERATPAELGRSLAGGDGRYALGARAAGEAWQGSLFLTGALVNTPRDGGAAFPAVNSDEQAALVGRGSTVLSKSQDHLLHIGASATWVFSPGQTADPSAPVGAIRSPVRLRDRPELRVDGTRFIDTGNINAGAATALGAEMAGHWKSFHAQGEFFRYTIDRKTVTGPALPDADFTGWYAQAGWVLTGEAKRYNAQSGAYGNPRPDKPFNLSTGDLGAWEVAARYSLADLNDRADDPLAAARIRGGRQEVVTLGLNWYPNSNVRFLLNYLFVDIDRRNPGGFTGPLAVTAPNGEIGQSFQAIALRTQLTF